MINFDSYSIKFKFEKNLKICQPLRVVLDDFLIIAPAEDEGPAEGHGQAEDIGAVLGIHDPGHDLTRSRPGPRPV